MSGTTEGGKKAAETRGHESLSEAGRKGGLRSHGNAGDKKSDDQSNRPDSNRPDLNHPDSGRSKTSESQNDKPYRESRSINPRTTEEE